MSLGSSPCTSPKHAVSCVRHRLAIRFLHDSIHRQNIFLSENFSTDAKEAEVQQFYEDQQDLLELTTKKDVLFITGDWNAKLGSQEISGITGNYGLGVQNEAGQRLRVLPRNHTSHSKHPSSNNMRDSSSHGHHQMVNTRIRLIIFFAAEDGEALYSQQKQDQELTVAQIMNSLLPNSELN